MQTLLALPSPQHARRFVVVVGVAYTRESDAAFDAACDIAEGRHAEIHAVHAVPLAPLPYSYESLDVAPHLDVAHEAARLDALCERVSSAHRITRHVRLGAPDHAIVDVAREHHADLVVIGGGARGALGRWLGGSVVDRVLRDAPCAVLVAKS